MRYRTEQRIIGMAAVGIFIIIYSLIKFFTSPAGKIFTVLALTLFVIFVIVKLFYMDVLYEKFSTKLVQKKFVINNTVLRNVNCTVNLTSGQKIVVMENNFGPDNTKKMFTVSKNDTAINKSWYKICRIFDEFSNISSLAAFFNLESINVDFITFDKKITKK